LQSVATNGIGVGDRLTALGGVDDQGDFVVLDHVDHVRTTLGHLVHATNRQAGGLDHLGGAGGGDHLEAKVDQFLGDADDEWLVVFAHADERGAGIRQDL